LIEEAGYLGAPFQAGAGGISLAFLGFLAERMRARGVRAPFARGGSTQHLVDLLREGLVGYILDGQSFDLAGVASLRDNPRHIATSPFVSYNYHSKGNLASQVGVSVLGATEVDVAFRANVVSHSDGLLLHGIGGWMNTLFADVSILAFPLFRNRIPIVVDEVITCCAPPELIDVVVTERGIAVNPRRQDLLERLRGSSLPLLRIEELRDLARRICGQPQAPHRDLDQPVAVVKWVDGTVIDTVWRVEE
jgi:citrate lyase subunit alpha/citrate CoA-transferase